MKLKIITALLFIVVSVLYFSQPERVDVIKPELKITDPSGITDTRERIAAVYNILSQGRYKEAYTWLEQAETWEAPASFMALYLLSLRDLEKNTEIPTINANAHSRLKRLVSLMEEAEEEQTEYMKNFLNTTRFIPSPLFFSSIDEENAEELKTARSIVESLDMIFFLSKAYGPGWKFLEGLRRDAPLLFDKEKAEKYNLHMKQGMITQ